MMEAPNKPSLISAFEFSPVDKARALATGIVQFGAIGTGDTVEVISTNDKHIECEVLRITESDDKNIELDLNYNIDNETFNWGWIISPPHSIPFHKAFLAEVTYFSAEEEGRTKPLHFKGGKYTYSYEVILWIHDKSFLCVADHPDADEKTLIDVAPGDTTHLHVYVGRYLPLEVGYRFLLSEGPVRVATGIVIKLYAEHDLPVR